MKMTNYRKINGCRGGACVGSVNKLRYFGDVPNRDGGANSASMARVRCA